MTINSLTLGLAITALVASLGWWRAARIARTATASRDSKQRIIVEKNERLLIAGRELDKARSRLHAVALDLTTATIEIVHLRGQRDRLAAERDRALDHADQATVELTRAVLGDESAGPALSIIDGGARS